jgi:uncharacterized membrane protein HdeD (DUF308 family)
MDLQYENQFERALTARWWTLVIRGLAAITFGVLAFAAPRTSLLALLYLFGAYAIVDGVFAVAFATWRGRAGLRWGWWLFEGLASIGAGVLTFVWPGMSGMVLLSVIAVWALLTGVAEIAVAVRLRKVIRGEWLLAASGVLSIAGGVLLLLFPRSGALAVMWVIGTYALVFGILLTTLGVRMRGVGSRHRRFRRADAPSPA